MKNGFDGGHTDLPPGGNPGAKKLEDGLAIANRVTRDKEKIRLRKKFENDRRVHGYRGATDEVA